MVFSKIFFANFLILLANSIFVFSLIPQISLNHRIKSTKGLSDFFILITLNCQFIYLIYTFIADLPLIYKIINPIYAVLVLIIIFQRFYFLDKSNSEKGVLRFYGFNVCALIFFAKFIFDGHPDFAYQLIWFPIMIGLWKKVPQIFKVYQTKSVYGFSLLFIILSCSSCLLETFAGIILDLPLPVLLNGTKGILINLIFIIQFWLYKN